MLILLQLANNTDAHSPPGTPAAIAAHMSTFALHTHVTLQQSDRNRCHPNGPCAVAGRDPKWSETKLNTPGIDYVMARPMHPDPTSAANNRPRSPVKQATARPMIQGASPRCEGCGRVPPRCEGCGSRARGEGRVRCRQSAGVQEQLGIALHD